MVSPACHGCYRCAIWCAATTAPAAPAAAAVVLHSVAVCTGLRAGVAALGWQAATGRRPALLSVELALAPVVAVVARKESPRDGAPLHEPCGGREACGWMEEHGVSSSPAARATLPLDSLWARARMGEGGAVPAQKAN